MQIKIDMEDLSDRVLFKIQDALILEQGNTQEAGHDALYEIKVLTDQLNAFERSDAEKIELFEDIVRAYEDEGKATATWFRLEHTINVIRAELDRRCPF